MSTLISSSVSVADSSTEVTSSGPLATAAAERASSSSVDSYGSSTLISHNPASASDSVKELMYTTIPDHEQLATTASITYRVGDLAAGVFRFLWGMGPR